MAAAAGAAAAGIFRDTVAFGGGFADDTNGEFHVLKDDVFADGVHEMIDARVGQVGTVELEADGFADELRESVEQFAVEREAEVGVHFFLKLKKALLGAVPRAGLNHDEDDFAGLLVEGEGVEAAGIGDAEGRLRVEG